MATTSSTLSIVELLEKILLCLPESDIVRASAVNRHLRSTIRDSTKIQQKLFLKPVNQRGANRVIHHNPMLFEKMRSDPSQWEAGNNSGFESNLPGLAHSLRGDSINRFYFPSQTLIRKAMNEESASCRRMYLTQPPSNRALLSLRIKRNEPGAGYLNVLRLEKREGALNYEDVLKEIESVEETLLVGQSIDFDASWVDILLRCGVQQSQPLLSRPW